MEFNKIAEFLREREKYLYNKMQLAERSPEADKGDLDAIRWMWFETYYALLELNIPPIKNHSKCPVPKPYQS